MKLPKITTKQEEIIQLLYRHRFLDRTQIQALLGHKDKRRIITWLKDLRDKQYIQWIYDSTNFAGKNKPAIYYLALNGIRFLRAQDSKYQPSELRKRYKEFTRQQSFIDRCLTLADCCIALEASTSTDVQYSYVTMADYADPRSGYLFLSKLRPQLCFKKQQASVATTSYLLEVFDVTTPRYMLKKRLKDYIEFLDSNEWQDALDEDIPPIVLIACPTTADLIYTKRLARMLLEEEIDTHHIRFTALDKLKRHGVTGTIWEET